jgi:hypothetical protein
MQSLIFLLSWILTFQGSLNFPGREKDQHTGIRRANDIAAIESKYGESLQELFCYRNRVKSLHPFLNELHPVAIVENDTFYVFDLDETGSRYVFSRSAPTGMPVPEGIRAAFPLDFYDNRPACVVTGEVFDTPEGYVTIFHEFIHCHQWNNVEQGLRRELPLAVKALAEQDFMWEMNYPFPYGKPVFEKHYTAFIEALEMNDPAAAIIYRRELKDAISSFDFQYMVWQEWKEGFALFVENMIREHLGLGRNMVGRRMPYNRTVFYAGGEALIRSLSGEDPGLLTDLEALFHGMMNFSEKEELARALFTHRRENGKVSKCTQNPVLRAIVFF